MEGEDIIDSEGLLNLLLELLPVWFEHLKGGVVHQCLDESEHLLAQEKGSPKKQPLGSSRKDLAHFLLAP